MRKILVIVLSVLLAFFSISCEVNKSGESAQKSSASDETKQAVSKSKTQIVEDFSNSYKATNDAYVISGFLGAIEGDKSGGTIKIINTDMSSNSKLTNENISYIYKGIGATNSDITATDIKGLGTITGEYANEYARETKGTQTINLAVTFNNVSITFKYGDNKNGSITLSGAIKCDCIQHYPEDPKAKPTSFDVSFSSKDLVMNGNSYEDITCSGTINSDTDAPVIKFTSATVNGENVDLELLNQVGLSFKGNFGKMKY